MIGDMAFIIAALGRDDPDHLRSQQTEWLSRLHRETQTALQILLRLADEMAIDGEYEADDYENNWHRYVEKCPRCGNWHYPVCVAPSSAARERA